MDRRRSLALAVLCLASFMVVTDSTIVSIALPAMRWSSGSPGRTRSGSSTATPWPSGACSSSAAGRTTSDGRGLAAGLLNTSVQLGNAWGLGVVATLVAATAGPGTSAGGLGAGLLACAGLAPWPCR